MLSLAAAQRCYLRFGSLTPRSAGFIILDMTWNNGVVWMAPFATAGVQNSLNGADRRFDSEYSVAGSRERSPIVTMVSQTRRSIQLFIRFIDNFLGVAFNSECKAGRDCAPISRNPIVFFSNNSLSVIYGGRHIVFSRKTETKRGSLQCHQPTLRGVTT
jgi:hypothetical protein